MHGVTIRCVGLGIGSCESSRDQVESWLMVTTIVEDPKVIFKWVSHHAGFHILLCGNHELLAN